MENSRMRKTFLALVIGSLAIAQGRLGADETNVAANTNFEPARKASDEQPADPSTPPAAQPTEQPGAQPSANVEQPAPPSTAPNIQEVTREEVIRREEAQTAARALIDQGMKLYYDGQYEQAVAKLEMAVKILPRARVTEIDYNRAAHALTDGNYRLADAAYRATPPDYPKAKQLAEKALQYDPSNRSAENLIVKVKQAEQQQAWEKQHPPPPPPPPAPNQTPEFDAKKDDIKKLFREGKILMNSGQYDAAEKTFKQILLIDPYNNDAYGFLTQLGALRDTAAQAGADATRADMLWKSTEAWVQPISSGVEVPKPGGPGGPLGPSVKSAEIMQKLNDIIFPEVNFREAVVSDVVKFLSDESRKLDAPSHNGVNIVLSAGLAGSSEAPTAPPPTEGGQPQPTPVGGVGIVVPKISLNLRNTPMIDVLKYVTQLADLKFLIDSSAVVILPTNAPAGQMITRSYHVNPGVFIPFLEVTNRPTVTQQTQQTGGGGGGAAQAAPSVQAGPSSVLPDVSIAVLSSNEVLQTFIEAGVEFPPGSSIFFYPRNSTIIVRNTPENIENFERVLAALNAPPSQVEIEAKFIEISQSDLDELAFQWKVGNYNSGDIVINGGNSPTVFESGGANPNQDSTLGGLRTASSIQGNAIEALLAAQGFGSVGTVNDTVMTVRGILTNPQFQVVVQALSQKRSSDLLSAPKVTTVSGQQAQIRVAQEFIYPTAYTAPTAVSSAGNVGSAGVAATPSTPSAFATRPVGVVFNVTPMVGADGYTINLSLIPQVTDFLGFINYGSTIALSAGNNVIQVPNDIKQPLFTTRDVVTSVVIWDGQTVVLGGLIRNDVQKVDDKIPFLGDLPGVGRLFRSKVTIQDKRNLLIFVTARLIDPAGNPVHRPPNT
jgi:general secretion pathway protein D